MTDFERDVALALHELLEHAQCPDGFPQPNDWERASQLAPRVAAAIQAATHVRSKPSWPMGIHTPDTAAMAEAALAALRGSGETPQP